jgi:aspartate/methionine/tyrosine aminotransferase
MTSSRRDLRSPYMEWAKLHSHARFELSTSGVENYPLNRLPVRLEDLEITGPGAYGYPPLQERLARKAGVPVECVVAAAGTSMANFLAMAAVLDPGDDEVLIEHPTYELIVSTAEFLGASVRRFFRRVEDGFRVDPGEVERAMTPQTRLVVLTNLNNPTGVRVEDETLREVGRIAAAHGARVLVDEVYLEACFDSPARSAFHLGANFLATSSLTKAYGLSGLRCGWILAEPALAERMWRHFDFIGASSAHTAERMSVIALDHLGQVATRARALLDCNRQLLDRFLDSRSDLDVVRPQAGTVCFPKLRGGRVDEFCRILREKYDTSVVPGRFFEMPDHFRIGIGGETAMVEEGLAQLSKALDDL